MTETIEKYALGDWVVHLHYGMGQIKKTEVKHLHGEKVKCYQVQTKDATFWFPVNEIDNPRIRPVASRERLKQGLEILNKPPRNFNADYKEVKKRINEVKGESSILSMARLLRDLSARSAVKKLNDIEEQTLRSFTTQFLKEWTMCTGIGIDSAREQLRTILQQSQDWAHNN